MQSYRRYRIRLDAVASKKKHEDDVRAMSRLEDWAATHIQALARGAAGRAVAAARRVEHMARWKEMYDDERGAHFYYNKVKKKEKKSSVECHEGDFKCAGRFMVSFTLASAHERQRGYHFFLWVPLPGHCSWSSP